MTIRYAGRNSSLHTGQSSILKVERWSTRWYSVKNSLKKRHWTCHQMDCMTYIEKSMTENPTRQNALTSAVYFIFYIYCSVHRNILWNDQQMQQCTVSLFLCKSTVHVSGGTQAHHQEYRSNCIYSHWYNYCCNR